MGSVYYGLLCECSEIPSRPLKEPPLSRRELWLLGQGRELRDSSTIEATEFHERSEHHRRTDTWPVINFTWSIL